MARGSGVFTISRLGFLLLDQVTMRLKAVQPIRTAQVGFVGPWDDALDHHRTSHTREYGLREMPRQIIKQLPYQTAGPDWVIHQLPRHHYQTVVHLAVLPHIVLHRIEPRPAAAVQIAGTRARALSHAEQRWAMVLSV
eukprot:COSAG02_NODE_15356_length_1178_cov_4.527800_2_plen_138_part_00